MLKDQKRVSFILNNIRTKHSPNLICSGEYPRLNLLFLCEDYDSFINENDMSIKPESLIKKYGSNYDEMLWGHIDWDKMFQDVITELSESNSSEDLGESFEKTLVTYAPYAVIKYEKLHSEALRIFYSQDEIKEKRQEAVEWVHLRHGSVLFRQSFYEMFSGKILPDFDKGFDDFISKYLLKINSNAYAIGSQVYNIHINLSGYEAYWQNIPGIQYNDVPDKYSDLETLLKEYIDKGREYMWEIAKYQQKFDALHIDIK